MSKLLQAHGAIASKTGGQRSDSVTARILRQQSTLAAGTDTSDAQRPFAGWQPLMEAAWRGQEDIVRVLLAQGVEVDARDTAGQRH